MRSFDPHSMVALDVLVGLFEPGAIVLSGGLCGLMDGHHHRTQKRRLRAGQVVSAIGVEHGAVVLNLEEEIVHHSARQIQSSVPQQAANNEIAIPSVHFIEASAWNYVLVFE